MQWENKHFTQQQTTTSAKNVIIIWSIGESYALPCVTSKWFFLCIKKNESKRGMLMQFWCTLIIIIKLATHTHTHTLTVFVMDVMCSHNNNQAKQVRGFGQKTRLCASLVFGWHKCQTRQQQQQQKQNSQPSVAGLKSVSGFIRIQSHSLFVCLFLISVNNQMPWTLLFFIIIAV